MGLSLDLSALVPARPVAALPGYAVERRARPASRPLAERMAYWGVPGLSVAVLAPGEPVWTAAYGVAEASGGWAVTAQTLFQAASISKPVTGLGVLRLVADGRLDLDADVNSYLRTWQVRAARGDWRPRVTVRQLLSHMAGVTVHGFPGYRRGAPLPTLLQVLDGLPPANSAAVRVDTLPGAQFRYSGGGTCVLQLVMEEVTGEPFAALMRRLVLEPLGMGRSAYGAPVEEGAVAHGHRTGGAPVDGGWHVYPELGAAALWTTPADLARVVAGLQASLAGEPGALLPQDLARDAVRRQGGLGFGLGWEITSGAFRHTGGNEGYRCVLTGSLAGGGGAVVMTNGDAGDALYAEVLATIGQAMGWEGQRPAAAGRYALRPDFVLEVEERDGRRWLGVPGQPPFLLEADGAGGFVAEGLSVGVTLDGDTLVVRQNGSEMRARRLVGDGGLR